MARLVGPVRDTFFQTQKLVLAIFILKLEARCMNLCTDGVDLAGWPPFGTNQAWLVRVEGKERPRMVGWPVPPLGQTPGTWSREQFAY